MRVLNLIVGKRFIRFYLEKFRPEHGKEVLVYDTTEVTRKNKTPKVFLTLDLLKFPFSNNGKE